EIHDRVRVVPIDAVARRQPGELELALPAPLDLRARLVDLDGCPQRGTLWIGRGEPPSGPEGLAPAAEMPRARTWRADADLWVLPAEPRFAPRRLARALPGDATGLDLGAVVLEPVGARRVTLVDAGGAPLERAEVTHFAALGRHLPTLDADGAFDSPAFPARTGDALAVRPADGGPTFHAVLAGEGPWTVQRPDTRALFEVVDEEGAPLARFRVVVAGEVFAGTDGRLELAGLDPGRHAAFVAADGRVAWRQPLELAPAEVLELRVTLPAR
ncbi:MAG TPA: carboxypeptidase-like regulatory domain-containing protein, partial [Planctomycetota bacterium]|nr:carboxypeptidase-like regulatory domain-containing protein [Planctomycetota bacterium]